MSEEAIVQLVALLGTFVLVGIIVWVAKRCYCK